MNDIFCTYCNKPIISKEDILLGTHRVYILTSYHVKCFDEAQKNENFLNKPVKKILPKKFNFFLGVGILDMIIGIIIIYYGILTFSSQKPEPILIILGLCCLILGLIYAAKLLKYKKFVEKSN
jgi:hypothetical protein